jgi:hypothetical protein
MESPPQHHIFRLYWRSFLPLWLLPILPALAKLWFTGAQSLSRRLDSITADT